MNREEKAKYIDDLATELSASNIFYLVVINDFIDINLRNAKKIKKEARIKFILLKTEGMNSKKAK